MVALTVHCIFCHCLCCWILDTAQRQIVLQMLIPSFCLFSIRAETFRARIRGKDAVYGTSDASGELDDVDEIDDLIRLAILILLPRYTAARRLKEMLDSWA